MFDIEAIPLFNDCQAFKAGEPEPINVVDPPLQTVKLPVIVGKLLTTITIEFE